MKRGSERIAQVESYIAGFGFVGVCLIIFVSAVMRGIGVPLNWAWDMSLFLFAWSVFVAADAAMRQDKLINVDLVINTFPERWRERIAVVNYAIILVFLVATVAFGFYLSYTTRSRTFQGMPHLSYTWVTLSVPVGAALQTETCIGKLSAARRRARERRNAVRASREGEES